MANVKEIETNRLRDKKGEEIPIVLPAATKMLYAYKV